jgi:hypothetical protein
MSILTVGAHAAQPDPFNHRGRDPAIARILTKSHVD